MPRCVFCKDFGQFCANSWRKTIGGEGFSLGERMTTLEGFVVMMIVCGAEACGGATTTCAGEYSTLEDEYVSQKEDDGDGANEENGG